MNSSSKQSASLLKYFEDLEDPRTHYLIEHRLLDKDKNFLWSENREI